jgi:hypothetical protein
MMDNTGSISVKNGRKGREEISVTVQVKENLS